MTLFPLFVYHNGGIHARKGGTYSYTLVQNDAELQTALVNGAYLHVDDIGKPTEVKEETVAEEVKAEILPALDEDKAEKPKRGRKKKDS